MFLPEEEYQKILKSMPVFCIDWLIRCGDEYLMLKRKWDPLANEWWVIGGRMYIGETISDAAKRIQTREIGKFVGVGQFLGFANYFFPGSERAYHTPTICYLQVVREKFVPILSENESEYQWSKELPKQFLSDNTFTLPSFM